MAFFLRLHSAFLFVLALALAYRHPVWPVPMIAGVVLIAFVVSKRPWLLPLIVPVLLVCGDAYPLTGQLLFQEYDPLLLSAIASCCWVLAQPRVKRDSIAAAPHMRFAERYPLDVLAVVVIMALSLLVSLVIGLYRLPSGEWCDQLSTYFTDQNALRVLKGYLLGGLCVSTFSAMKQSLHIDYRRQILLGMKLAGIYVSAFVILERVVYESLLDLSNDYRATGPFFTMHIGDQHIDGFLVLCLPLVWFRNGPVSTKYVLCNTSLSALLVTTAVFTMSRATIVSVLMQVTLLGFMLIFGIGSNESQGQSGWKPRIRYTALFGSLLLVSIACVAIGASAAIRTRFSSWREDLDVRLTHWRDLLLTDRWTLMEVAFGHGLGTVPTDSASRKGLPIPPLQWQTSQNGGKMIMKGGWPLYVERFYWQPSTFPARISLLASRLDAPSPSDTGPVKDATLQVFRCVKSILHSYEISSHLCHIKIAKDGSAEATVTSQCEMSFDALSPIEKDKWVRRYRFESIGVMLPQSGTYSIEALMVDRGETQEWIAPGSAGSAPWMFTCDDLLTWRASNAIVHLLYEQGILGCIAWMGLVAVVFRRCLMGRFSATSAFNNRLILGAGLGFGIVAFYGSLIDTPWIVALLFVLLSVSEKAQDSRTQ